MKHESPFSKSTKPNCKLIKPHNNTEFGYALDVFGYLEVYFENPFIWGKDSLPRIIIKDGIGEVFYEAKKPLASRYKLLLLADAYHEPLDKNDKPVDIYRAGYICNNFYSVRTGG